jgi:UDP-N-acetylglucosamine/UDP-N-acetylgalactosamine diphosphorylase
MSLEVRLRAAGQEHLVAYLASLPEGRRARLEAQLRTLDLETMARVRTGEDLAPPPPREIEPVPYVPFEARARDSAAAARGARALRDGAVGFVLVAGGMASRLRHEAPKGTFPIGPRTDRSLFEILTEKVLRAGRGAGRVPSFCVTTSHETDGEIRAFFAARARFGYPAERLAFACQASLPYLDGEGRFLLAGPDRIAVGPDGHGGALIALHDAGLLDRWSAEGVECVCTFQVDNPLLRVADADMIGRLLLEDAPIATKVVVKTDPRERVGVVVRAAGRPAVVEYSEISEEDAHRRDAEGRLVFRLGSVAAHAFRIDFLKRELARGLPLHAARKEVACMGLDGRAARNFGTKLERFIFDLFPRATSVVVVEALRDREYAPLKNADGPDSPATVRAALDREYRRWYREAALRVPDDGPLEVSPLLAEGPEDLLRS